jgi:hypothetical protein
MRRWCAFSLLALTWSHVASAGSADATLECKSGSGRSALSAILQDIDGGLQRATATVDGESITFEQSDRSAVVFDAAHGVFTISIEGAPTPRFPNGRFLRFYALPKSFRGADKTPDGKGTWSFTAIFRCTEPRKSKEQLLTPDIEVVCKLVYGI